MLQEGIPVVAVLRALQGHFRRLHATKTRMEAGQNAAEAMKSLAPPIFFKQEDAFRGQLSRWQVRTLENTLSRLADLEARCKQTNAPDETLCAQAILNLASR